MASVTPTVVAGEGYVRIEVNFQDFPHARKVWIYRVVNGVATPLRDGDYVWLSNGVAVAYDHEMPLDTNVSYRASIGLNYNGKFNEGVAEWLDTTNNGTTGIVEQSFDYYVAGQSTASLKLTPPFPSVANVKAVSEFIPATAGQSYTLTGKLMISDYWNGGIGVQIQWYNGLTPLTTSGAFNDLNPVPGVFGDYGFSSTAPATTTQMRIVAGMAGTPSQSDGPRLYVGEIYATTSGTTVNSGTVNVASSGDGWWTDPLHPATKLKLDMDLSVAGCVPTTGLGLVGLTEETFPADSEANEVNDAVYPIGTWNRRKSGRSSMVVATLSMADLAAVKSLHASGAPLLLALPAAYGEDSAYQLHGELAVSRLVPDHRHPWRLVRSSFAKVATPVGPPEGTLKTRYMDFTKVSTFAEAAGSGSGAYDTFSRITSPGLGSAPSGGTYVYPGGVNTDWSANGSEAVASIGSLSTQRRAQLQGPDVAAQNVDASIGPLTLPVTLTGAGGQSQWELRARMVDGSNHVAIRAFRRVNTNDIVVDINSITGGVSTTSAQVAIPGAVHNSQIMLRIVANQAASPQLQGWAWVFNGPMPVAPLVTIATATHTTSGGAEFNASLNANVTNTLPVAVRFDNLIVTDLATSFTWLDGLQGELTL